MGLDLFNCTYSDPFIAFHTYYWLLYIRLLKKNDYLCSRKTNITLTNNL